MRTPENKLGLIRKAIIAGGISMAIAGCASADKSHTLAKTQTSEPTAVPSQAISSEPTNTANPSESVYLCVTSPEVGRCATQIENGEIYEAKATDFIMGDVEIGPTDTTVEQFKANEKNHNNPNIVIMYDSKGHTDEGKDERNTGLITYMKIDGAVYAPYAAGAAHNVPEDQRTGFIEGQNLGMQMTGCTFSETNKGCTDGIYETDYIGTNTKPEGSGNMAGYLPIETPSPTATIEPSQMPSPSLK